MTVIREIDVRKQATLSFARVFKLVLAGISHRFFRSFLTMAVIMLAVAFFMAMLSESIFLRSTAQGVAGEIAATRDPTRRLGLYFNPPTTTALLAGQLAAADGDADVLVEYATVARADAGEVALLAAECARERTYRHFMDGLKIGHRSILFGKRRDRDAFRHLVPAEAWDEFLKNLHGLPAVRLPEPTAAVAERVTGGRDLTGTRVVVEVELAGLPTTPAVLGFRDFLDGFDAYLARLGRFDRQWREAIAGFAARSRTLTGVDDLGIVHWLADAGDAPAEEWRRLVEDAGFRLDAKAFAGMRAYFRKADLRNRLRRELGTPQLRERWRQAFPDRRGMSIDDKILMLERPEAVRLTEPHPAGELAEASRFATDRDRMRIFHQLLATQPPPKPAEGDEERSMKDVLAMELQSLDLHFAQADAFEPGPLDAWLDRATPEAVAQFGAVVMEQFVRTTSGERRDLQRTLRIAERTARLRSELTSDPAVLARWEALPAPVRGGDTLAEKFAFLARPEAGTLWPRAGAEELAEVARMTRRESRLNDLEGYLGSKLEGSLSAERGVLSGRQLFLLLISFCVCMVGIANAMLMAITERFREIATMKCLGATDGFILTQFMMEAGLQGLIGGVLGMLGGLVLSLVKNGWLFGQYLWRYFPVGDLVVCCVICVCAGVALAVFASLYPSWAASRMAPMEAMRVE